jgi:hypothetical protein
MNYHRLPQDAAPTAKPMPAIMMRAIRTLFALFLLAMAPAHADTPQQQWVGDLPIMEGMTIEPELGFAFDSPSGRIVLVFAAATDSESAILAYYDAALASLGWQGGGGNWNRGSESLTLGQVDTSVGRLWRIRLSPN